MCRAKHTLLPPLPINSVNFTLVLLSFHTSLGSPHPALQSLAALSLFAHSLPPSLSLLTRLGAHWVRQLLLQLLLLLLPVVRAAKGGEEERRIPPIHPPLRRQRADKQQWSSSTYGGGRGGGMVRLRPVGTAPLPLSSHTKPYTGK